jgi:hypothetical protein
MATHGVSVGADAGNAQSLLQLYVVDSILAQTAKPNQ